MRYTPGVRRGQSTVEYLLTISVISIAIVALLYALMSTMSGAGSSLGSSLATSLTSDPVQ
jgi:Flp pilus assembly pilin Flp